MFSPVLLYQACAYICILSCNLLPEKYSHKKSMQTFANGKLLLPPHFSEYNHAELFILTYLFQGHYIL